MNVKLRAAVVDAEEYAAAEGGGGEAVRGKKIDQRSRWRQYVVRGCTSLGDWVIAAASSRYLFETSQAPQV